jgi:hypothetical protein
MVLPGVVLDAITRVFGYTFLELGVNHSAMVLVHSGIHKAVAKGRRYAITFSIASMGR